jgi:cell wall-associated NlpC family hydrolase
MKWLSIVLSATAAVTPGPGVAAIDTEGRTPSGVVSFGPETPVESSFFDELLAESKESLTTQPPMARSILQEAAANQVRRASNTLKMNKAITAVRKQVGKTWYVFSGATPSGWDCSGLVMWTYQQLGIELEHSATAQAHAGKVVTDPVPGDIVAFSYDGKKWFYHVGLYIGNGKMIHAKARGTVTRIESVDEFAGPSVKVRFIRIVDQLQPAA